MRSEIWRYYYLEALKNVNIDKELHLTEEQLLEMADEVADFRENEDLALGSDVLSNNRYGYQERQLRLAEADLEKAIQAAADHKRELDKFYTVRCPNCGGTGIKDHWPCGVCSGSGKIWRIKHE